MLAVLLGVAPLGVASVRAQDSAASEHKPKKAAKPVAKKPPAAPKTETARAAPAAPAQDVFAGIPTNERFAMQSALLWSGDYTGAAGGEDPMLAAIRNFQKRIKSKITGMLSDSDRAALLAEARQHEQDFGWSVVVDPATGVRIGLPSKMVPQAHEAARGTRWSSRHGDVQVETFRYRNPDVNLAALFEQQKKEPSSRRVEYSLLRPDSFIVSGMQGLKYFSVRAQSRNGEIRGFTMLYDQAMEGIMAPVMVAMAAAFSPFPDQDAAFAALNRPVEYGSGLVVSAQGHIVTDRKVADGCQVIVAAGLGDAERVADDKDNGIALLRIYGPRKLSPVALGGATAQAGDITLVGIPDPKAQDGGKTLTEIKARLTDGQSIELRDPVPVAGFSGAAALDTQGRLLGIMETRTAVLASAGPASAPVRLITAETIRKLLAAQKVAPVAQSGDARAAVVRIICVRK